MTTPEIQSPQPAPRPLTAVKAFADSVLAMLDERIKAVDQAAHPFNDYFGDQPETIVAAKAQAGELREVRTQVRILGDRALVDLMKFKLAIPAPEGGPSLAVAARELLFALTVADDGCTDGGLGPGYQNGHGEEVGTRIAAARAALRAALAAQPVMINGLTEAETSETASVRGLICRPAPAEGDSLPAGSVQEFAASDNPRCRDGYAACIDCLMRGECASKPQPKGTVDAAEPESGDWLSRAVGRLADAVSNAVTYTVKAHGHDGRVHMDEVAAHGALSEALGTFERTVRDALAAQAPAVGADEPATREVCGRSYVEVRTEAVDWLKKHYPALCEKSGLCERIGGRLYTRSVTPAPKAAPLPLERPLTGCAAGKDGDCTHSKCPQLRDGEPLKTGRHCPLDSDVPVQGSES